MKVYNNTIYNKQILIYNNILKRKKLLINKFFLLIFSILKFLQNQLNFSFNFFYFSKDLIFL